MATPNLALAYAVVLVPVHLAGRYTATTAAIARLKLPFRAKLLGVSASARASGGTAPTLTVNVKEGATSVLSAPITVTAGAVAEGTIADAALADEAILTVDLAIGGSDTPTWDDIDVLLTLVRT